MLSLEVMGPGSLSVTLRCIILVKHESENVLAGGSGDVGRQLLQGSNCSVRLSVVRTAGGGGVENTISV